MKQDFPSDQMKVALFLVGVALLCAFLYELAFPCKKYGEEEVYTETCHGETIRTCSGRWETVQVCLER